MSVAGDPGDDGGGSEPVETPPELEGDVPKPTFELPEKDTPEPEAPKQNAKERHRERGFAMGEMKRELERERAERQKLSESMAELRGRMEARQAPANTGPTPLEEQLKANRRAIENALDRMSRGDTAAVEEWHAAREREQRLISRHEAETVAAESARNAPKPMDAVLSEVTSKYPWLQSDDDARAIAEANVRRLVRRESRDMNNPAVRRQTLLQAAAETARDLELGGDDEPTEPNRERYRGVAGQSSGAGRTSGRSVVSLTGEQKAQAEALFRHMEPEAAHKEWWAKVGAKIANK